MKISKWILQLPWKPYKGAKYRYFKTQDKAFACARRIASRSPGINIYVGQKGSQDVTWFRGENKGEGYNRQCMWTILNPDWVVQIRTIK